MLDGLDDELCTIHDDQYHSSSGQAVDPSGLDDWRRRGTRDRATGQHRPDLPRPHWHLEDELLRQLGVSPAEMVLHNLYCLSIQSVHRCVMNAENGVLQALIGLQVLDPYAATLCLIPVNAKRVGLVDLIVGEIPRYLFSLLGSVGGPAEHVTFQPFLDQALRQGLCRLALLDNRRPVLLEDRDPWPSSAGSLYSSFARSNCSKIARAGAVQAAVTI